MFQAIKDNKIIAISETDSEFKFMTKDSVKTDNEHTIADYTMVGSEYVLNDDEKAIEAKNKERIEELKQLLADSDYWTSKYCDGEYTDEEWAEKVTQRKAWREEIRELEK